MNVDYDYMTADPGLYGRLKEYSKWNKTHQTQAESVLWTFLRGGALGQPFRRQHIIGVFIADFICLPLKLIIEADGGYHSIPEQRISDEERTKWLTSKGFTVLRFTNDEILCDTANVIDRIKSQLG